MHKQDTIEGLPEGMAQSAKEVKSRSINANDAPMQGELRFERYQQLCGFVLLAIVVIAATLMVLPIGEKALPGKDEVSPQTTEQIETESAALPLSGRTVIIDAGHGGFDPGAVGLEKTLEAPLNLEIAQKLENELISRGAKTAMTRKDGEALADDKNGDMQARSRLYKETEADVGVSIHMNKFEKSNVSGPMVFYYPNSTEGRQLAQIVQDELDKALERSKPRIAHSANYFILRESKTLSILVECGFLSNPDDVWLLKKDEHQNKLVVAIADGIEKYLTSPHVSTASASPSNDPQLQPTLSDLCPGLDPSAFFDIY